MMKGPRAKVHPSGMSPTRPKKGLKRRNSLTERPGVKRALHMMGPVGLFVFFAGLLGAEVWYHAMELEIGELRKTLGDCDHELLIWDMTGRTASEAPKTATECLDKAHRSMRSVTRVARKFDRVMDHRLRTIKKDLREYRRGYEDVRTSGMSDVDAYSRAFEDARGTVSGMYHHSERVVVRLAFGLAAAVLLVLLALTSTHSEALRNRVLMRSWRKSHRALIKRLGVPAFVVSGDNMTIVDVNPAALETFGYKKRRHELLDQPISIVLPHLRPASLGDDDIDDDTSDSFSLWSDDHTTVPPARPCNTEGRHRSGEALEVVVNRTVNHDGADRYETVVAQDLTDLVTKERELEIQKKCLSQFTHEMRNKYSPASATLEQILDVVRSSESPSKLYANLSPMHDEIQLSIALLEEADQLVSTRLQLHKMFRGNYQSQPNVQTVDVVDVMESRARSAAALASKDVEFRTSVPAMYAQSVVYLRFDTFVFSHIANNLLSNARKHTSTGYVSLAFLEAKEGMLYFATEDTGKGMPESIWSRLFKEEVASGDVRGVGLGLSSAKLFLEAIGGDIRLEWTRETTVEHPTQGGTRFLFWLPGDFVKSEPFETLVDLDSASPRGSLSPSGHGEHPQGRSSHHPKSRHSFTAIPTDLTIHVVEDSDVIRKSVVTKCAQVAKRLGFERWPCHEYSTVEEILPKLDAFKEDDKAVVIVDQNLDSKGGVLQGSDLLRALVQRGFKGCMISASGDDVVQAEHEKLGAHIMWAKPMPKVAAMLEDLAAFYGGRLLRDASGRRLASDASTGRRSTPVDALTDAMVKTLSQFNLKTPVATSDGSPRSARSPWSALTGRFKDKVRSPARSSQDGMNQDAPVISHQKPLA